MIFDQVTQAPADPILGLTEAFKGDNRANKVNLGVGIYKNEQGETPILDCVKLAELTLLQTQTSKAYLGIAGATEYNNAVLALLFGQNSQIIKEKKAASVQTPGGTGALRIAAEFIKQNTNSQKIWVSTPTWANHHSIFLASKLTIQEYRYYDKENNQFDFDGMMADLNKAQKGDLILLHACCHNPTGIDPSLAQWKKIAEICKNNELVPFFDFAYQGFGNGIEEDAQGLRIVAETVPELLVASSFSKNFGLYNERIGAVTLVSNDEKTTNKALSQIKKVIRANYSNPPAHGALIVSTILTDPELHAKWIDEVTEMRERIISMRQLFVHALKAAGINRNFDFIMDQQGMFSFSGLTKEQVDKLKKEFAVYIVGSGRISVAGLTTQNIPYLCHAISQVID